MAPTETRRKTRPAEPRERKALTRNRPTPAASRRSRPRWSGRTPRPGRRAAPRAPSARCRPRSGHASASLRSRPSMRTRGGEPTLQCRSEPPQSTSARRNGSIISAGVTSGASARVGADLDRSVTDCAISSAVRRSVDDGDDVAFLDDLALVDPQLGRRCRQPRRAPGSPSSCDSRMTSVSPSATGSPWRRPRPSRRWPPSQRGPLPRGLLSRARVRADPAMNGCGDQHPVPRRPRRAKWRGLRRVARRVPPSAAQPTGFRGTLHATPHDTPMSAQRGADLGRRTSPPCHGTRR